MDTTYKPLASHSRHITIKLLCLFLYLALIGALTCLHIEFSIDRPWGFFFEFTGFLLFGVFLLLLGFILSKKIIKIGAAIVATCILEFISVAIVTEYQVAKTLLSADKIITALANYQLEQGQYPLDLKQLDTHFLTLVPQPTTGLRERKFYYKNHGDFYRLFFNGVDGAPYHYYSNREIWSTEK